MYNPHHFPMMSTAIVAKCDQFRKPSSYPPHERYTLPDAERARLARLWWRMPDTVAAGPLARCWKIAPLASTVLAWLAVQARCPEGGTWSVPVDVTHAKLATLCAAHRWRVGKALAGLEEKGLIQSEHRPHPTDHRLHTFRFRVAGALYAGPRQRFTAITGQDLLDQRGDEHTPGRKRHVERHLWLTGRALLPVKDAGALEGRLQNTEQHRRPDGDPEDIVAERARRGLPSLALLAKASGMTRQVVARHVAPDEIGPRRTLPASARPVAAAPAAPRAHPKPIAPPVAPLRPVGPKPARPVVEPGWADRVRAEYGARQAAKSDAAGILAGLTARMAVPALPVDPWAEPMGPYLRRGGGRGTPTS